MLRFLLTGATGYLGSHLLLEMRRAGHQVIIAARDSCRCTTGKFYGTEYIDVTSQELGSKLAERNIDAIIHTATCYGRKGESLSEICEANLMLPLKLLDAASLAGVHTFINADTVLPPEINAYARSKAQLCDWGKEFACSRQRRFINFKIDHMYGPAEDPTKFVTRIARLCLANVETIELTEGRQFRDFIHIEDVISAYMVVLSRQEALPHGFIEFEVGSGNSTEVRTLVEIIQRLTHSRAQLQFGVVPYRPSEVMNSRLDSTALRGLGWSPKIDIVTGLTALVAFERGKTR